MTRVNLLLWFNQLCKLGAVGGIRAEFHHPLLYKSHGYPWLIASVVDWLLEFLPRISCCFFYKAANLLLESLLLRCGLFRCCFFSSSFLWSGFLLAKWFPICMCLCITVTYSVAGSATPTTFAWFSHSFLGFTFVFFIQYSIWFRCRRLVMAISTNVNNISWIRNQILLPSLFCMTLADDMVRVKQRVFPTDTASSPYTSHNMSESLVILYLGVWSKGDSERCRCNHLSMPT